MTLQKEEEKQVVDPFDASVAKQLSIPLELVTAFRSRVRSQMGGHIKESYIPDLDEPGWEALGEDVTNINGYTRKQLNALAWKFYFHDPMTNHATNLHNAYIFGEGATLQAHETVKDVQDIIDDFWNSPSNQQVIGRASAQYELNKQRLHNGEVFFLLYVDKTNGHVEIRTLEPNDVIDIVYDDNDEKRPVAYRRRVRQKTYDWERHAYKHGDTIDVYLPDWRSVNPKFDHDKMYRKKLKTPATTEIFVYHAMSNQYRGRGLTHYSAGLPWVRAFKGFMEDRVVLQLALATFAYKLKIDGDQQAINELMSRVDAFSDQSNRFGQYNYGERRQGANWWVENQALDLQPQSPDTGAYQAYQDARMLRQLAGIGLGGIFEHYLAGDASTGNLATTTAMELPMLKIFGFEQQFWRSVMTDIAQFVLMAAVKYGGGHSQLAEIIVDKVFWTWRLKPKQAPDGNDYNLKITARFPEIIHRDASVYINAIAQLLQSESMLQKNYLPYKETVVTLLELIGFEDAHEIAEQMIEDIEKSNQQDSSPDNPNVIEDPQATQPGAIGDVTQSLNHKKGYAEKPFAFEWSDREQVWQIVPNRYVRGQPLDPDEGEKFEPITDEEMQDTLDDWLEYPTLDELVDKHDISDELVTE